MLKILIDRAVTLANSHFLRAGDAIQLAGAIVLKEVLDESVGSIIFLTSDQELLRAAAAEGFQVRDAETAP